MKAGLDSATDYRTHSTPKARQKMLYLTPYVPSSYGHGSAMRANFFLDILSEMYDIHLFVVHMYPKQCFHDRIEVLENRCASLTILPSGTSRGQIRSMLVASTGSGFDAVHVFRLCMAPLALHALSKLDHRPFLTIDVDDFESKSAMRVASFVASKGNAMAAWFRGVAFDFRNSERQFLPHFDHVYVSNPIDRNDVAAITGRDNVFVIPNAINIPVSRGFSRRPGSNTIAFLFVGTMHYLPNEDAVVYFCNEILPIIRDRLGGNFTFTIVGASPTNRVKELAGNAGVKVVEDVESVLEYYQNTDVAVVPLRLGGGTRVKILEACSYGVPVVATLLGAEGLSALDGKELLLAESTKQFAESCIRLAKDKPLRTQVGWAGYDWVLAHHSLATMREAVHKALESKTRSSKPKGT